MAKLGEFGRARQELSGETDSFLFHGEEFEVPAGISAVVLMDFVADTQEAQDAREDAIDRQGRAESRLARARSDADQQSAQAAVDAAMVDLISASNLLMKAMRSYVRSCLPDESSWRRFNTACRVNAVDIDELMEVAAAIFSAVAARPTTRQSSASDGLSAIGDGSTGESGSPAATDGPRPPDGDSRLTLVGEVVEMTDNQRQRAEAMAQMVPVERLLSGG